MNFNFFSNIMKEKYIQISGELFQEVQSKHIFYDSKTFPDSIPKREPQKILDDFLLKKNNPDFDLKKFVIENFELPKEEFIKLHLPEKRTMEEHINYLWNYLKRETQTDINKFSTLIALKFPYIVPGGRFREIYYWDSYFTMLGLLSSEQINICENMVNNFAYLIEQFGFIPNGNRIYYLTRSQPPFFSLMINLIGNFKKDIDWKIKYINLIEKEYSFWMNYSKDELNKNQSDKKVVLVNNIDLLNRYYDESEIPREESYYEDFNLALYLPEKDRKMFYKNIRASAESGWDFSSRWFKDGKSILTVNTTEILPIDLNSILFFMEKFLYESFKRKNEMSKSSFYQNKYERRKELINQIFWNDKENFYFDFNWIEKKLTNTFSLAALYPLYFQIATEEKAKSVANKIENIFLKDGGLITTTNFTNQQWDAPNGWAPLQWIGIIGLRNYGFYSLADEIKNRWLNLNKSVFERTGKMFEKYNVVDTTLFAGGGEYSLQDGFGWTNGVAIALLNDLDKNLSLLFNL